jgi:hypothetical protein
MNILGHRLIASKRNVFHLIEGDHRLPMGWNGGIAFGGGGFIRESEHGRQEDRGGEPNG